MAWQDFAEKPKGDALEKMKVDTTVLGEPHEHFARHPMTAARLMCLESTARLVCQPSTMSTTGAPYVLPSFLLMLRSAKV